MAVYKTQRDTESETQDRESEYFNQAAGLHVKKYISSSGWLQKQVIALASHVKMSKFTKLKSFLWMIFKLHNNVALATCLYPHS